MWGRGHTACTFTEQWTLRQKGWIYNMSNTVFQFQMFSKNFLPCYRIRSYRIYFHIKQSLFFLSHLSFHLIITDLIFSHLLSHLVLSHLISFYFKMLSIFSIVSLLIFLCNLIFDYFTSVFLSSQPLISQPLWSYLVLSKKKDDNGFSKQLESTWVETADYLVNFINNYLYLRVVQIVQNIKKGVGGGHFFKQPLIKELTVSWLNNTHNIGSGNSSRGQSTAVFSTENDTCVLSSSTSRSAAATTTALTDVSGLHCKSPDAARLPWTECPPLHWCHCWSTAPCVVHTAFGYSSLQQ